MIINAEITSNHAIMKIIYDAVSFNFWYVQNKIIRITLETIEIGNIEILINPLVLVYLIVVPSSQWFLDKFLYYSLWWSSAETNNKTSKKAIEKNKIDLDLFLENIKQIIFLKKN